MSVLYILVHILPKINIVNMCANFNYSNSLPIYELYFTYIIELLFIEPLCSTVHRLKTNKDT